MSLWLTSSNLAKTWCLLRLRWRWMGIYTPHKLLLIRSASYSEVACFKIPAKPKLAAAPSSIYCELKLWAVSVGNIVFLHGFPVESGSFRSAVISIQDSPPAGVVSVGVEIATETRCRWLVRGTDAETHITFGPCEIQVANITSTNSQVRRRSEAIPRQIWMKSSWIRSEEN